MINLTEVNIKKKSGSPISPKGFFACGLHIGLYESKKDFGILYSDTPASCAAVYTQSHFQAAPIHVTKKSIEQAKKIQAVVVNSAIANACTGEEGMENALEMRDLTAEALSIKSEQVAVASTGVIGQQLDMEKIRNGCKSIKLSNQDQAGEDFQEAILTTDLVTKTSCYEVEIDGEKVTLAGTAKGSGMIHPNMATMLSFISTDANIESNDLQSVLKEVVDQSFNQITVDGETSTNDMVLVMANGQAKNERLSPSHSQWTHFKETMKLVCQDLAKQIAKDGEGATKLVEVIVEEAFNHEEARILSKKIIGSNLVKTAIFGEDANWGRIVSTIGYSDIQVEPSKCKVYIGDTLVFKDGVGQNDFEQELTDYLKNKEVLIKVQLGLGNGYAQAWGCDLTYDYVKINASYRT
ncbi:bifunctional glutamate N-acetyltransferase/amino-acid acetyltransferase ArgJ [Bacillus carboniphilus]|uniref:Arginine biosynthesis bifunctional protein ArgJ n=1 Tax=Bacillus carboniphilus TaxID=86663 RepID=A0ABY9JWY3_9BACI|nr:bifunctional glutamate N-acetyltransferase/amino-acid acetyltransferase ArgJ [Bacillus carboniphilus]WLR42930.1 bifunctional glutamate N-acetyltransferase/amino-acid acetyltransferase ArgJ [Bacillus carboniphilus]